MAEEITDDLVKLDDPTSMVSNLVDTSEAEDSFSLDVYGNDVDTDESAKTDPGKRTKKAYKEATVRPMSKNEAWNEEGDLFGISEFFEKTPLSELQITQDEIRTHRKGSNGLKMISTFTGCGGSDTGFAWSGWNPLMAVEFVDSARETLNSNYDSYIITPESLVEKGREVAKAIGGEVKLEQSRKVKGKIIPASISWPDTLSAMTHDQQDEFRYELTKFGLKGGESKTTSGVPIFGDDIRGLSPKAVMEHMNIEVGELDCLEGSPPCKSFSTAGLREDGWGKVLHYSDERHQRTDDLFLEALRLLEGFRPRSFVFENVAGIGMGSAETEVLAPLMESFRELGYAAEAKILNSRNYGVPQSRPRMFFVGIRTDQKLTSGKNALPIFPKRFTETYTVQDALDFAAPNNTEEYLKACSIDGYETGKIWQTLGLGASPENKAYQMIRCHPNAPSPTITATSAGNQPSAGPTHPHECRKFTIPEYKALFSFPQDYNFKGNIDQQGERMGRSVPPFLMKQIADSLAGVLKKVA